MEINVSGFKLEGSWDEIVEHGEKITFLLNEYRGEEYTEEFTEFNNWRPKISEHIEKEIEDKTVEKAQIEYSVRPLTVILLHIVTVIDKIGRNIYQLNIVQIYNELRTFIFLLGETVESILINIFRKSEHFVYRNIMTTVSPYYFSNKLVSANIQKKNESKYVLEIDINDDKIRGEMEENVSIVEEKDRWHISHNGKILNIKNSEGVKIEEEKEKDFQNGNKLQTE